MAEVVLTQGDTTPTIIPTSIFRGVTKTFQNKLHLKKKNHLDFNVEKIGNIYAKKSQIIH